MESWHEEAERHEERKIKRRDENELKVSCTVGVEGSEESIADLIESTN